MNALTNRGSLFDDFFRDVAPGFDRASGAHRSSRGDKHVCEGVQPRQRRVAALRLDIAAAPGCAKTKRRGATDRDRAGRGGRDIVARRQHRRADRPARR